MLPRWPTVYLCMYIVTVNLKSFNLPFLKKVLEYWSNQPNEPKKYPHPKWGNDRYNKEER
jgi:hypothetical protein